MIETRYVKTLSADVGANSLAFLGMTDLVERNLVTAGLSVDWNNQALVAIYDGQEVGIICFSETEFLGCYHTGIGYVRPKWRHLGVYRVLWEALVARARENKIARVMGGTNWNNTEMRAVMEAFGRVPTSITYNYEVPQ